MPTHQHATQYLSEENKNHHACPPLAENETEGSDTTFLVVAVPSSFVIVSVRNSFNERTMRLIFESEISPQLLQHDILKLVRHS